MLPATSPRGFTLLETLVATSIIVTAVAGLAQLVVFSAATTRRASAAGVALAAAQQKLESLRALDFGFDDGGAPVTAVGLAPSPPNSLSADVDSRIDWLDASGVAQDDRRGAAFARRWRITTVDAAEPAMVAIEVCVFTAPPAATVRAADACLATLRVRQP